jgi:group I intron endonuclease
VGNVGWIYCALNTVNGKRYVGKTVVGVKVRWLQHLAQARALKEGRVRRGVRLCKYLARSLVKHGESSFIVETLGEYPQDNLDNLEQRWIALLNTQAPNGLNLTAGGEGQVAASPQTKQRLRAAWRNRKRRGWVPHNKGKHLSEDLRRKLSEAHKGKHLSTAAKDRLRQHWKNGSFKNTMSPESILKRAITMRGRKPSPEQVRKMRVTKLARELGTPVYRYDVTTGEIERFPSVYRMAGSEDSHDSLRHVRRNLRAKGHGVYGNFVCAFDRTLLRHPVSLSCVQKSKIKTIKQWRNCCVAA